MRTHSPQTLKRARQLRKEMSLPEVLLWRELKKRPDGYRFRRQHPFARYVLDFYCDAAKLAIEIDGVAHDMGDWPARDARRDQFLKDRGLSVLRIKAQDVLRDVAAVVLFVVEAVSQRVPPPTDLRSATSPMGEDFAGLTGVPTRGE